MSFSLSTGNFTARLCGSLICVDLYSKDPKTTSLLWPYRTKLLASSDFVQRRLLSLHILATSFETPWFTWFSLMNSLSNDELPWRHSFAKLQFNRLQSANKEQQRLTGSSINRKWSSFFGSQWRYVHPTVTRSWEIEKRKLSTTWGLQLYLKIAKYNLIAWSTCMLNAGTFFWCNSVNSLLTRLKITGAWWKLWAGAKNHELSQNSYIEHSRNE